MGYQVGLTESARDDLGAVVAFIATKNPEAAFRIGNELLDTALALTTFPKRGTSIKSRPGLRKLTHRHWLIIYQVNENTRWIEIVRIWDGRQNPASLRIP